MLSLPHLMVIFDYCYIMRPSGKGGLFRSNSAHLQGGKFDLMGAIMSQVTSSEERAGSAALGFNLCFASYER
jgi:hypothetical protein